MSVLGKRRRPADINEDVQSQKKLKKNAPTYEYISSDNEDEDLKSGEIDKLMISSESQSTNYQDYFSVNKGYNDKQQWKLFFIEDYQKYKYGIEEK